MIVPDVAPIESQAILTVEVRSTRDPSIIFTGTEMAIIPGAEIDDPPPVEDGIREIVVKWMNKWLEISLIIVVVVIGTAGVMKALSIRSREMENPRETKGLETGKAEEWISRFKKEEVVETGVIESPILPHSEFKTNFMEKSGGVSEKPLESPDGRIVSEASNILDEAQTEDDIQEAMRIADELTGDDILHPDNEILEVPGETGNRVDSSSDDEVPSDFDLEI